MQPSSSRALLVGVAAYTMWGLLTIYWKHLHRFDPFELIAWRVLASAAVMAAVLTVWRHWPRLLSTSAGHRRRIALAAVAVLVNWTAYVVAVVNGRVLETALGYFIAPLTTIAVGVLVAGESLTRARRVAVALGVAAVVILGISVGRVPWLALAIAASWTLYGFLKRHIPVAAVDGMAAEVFVLAAPAALALALLGRRSDSVVHTASAAQIALLAMSGLATVIPLTMYAYAARRLPMTILAPTQYVVPSINFLLGWLAYHEPLNGLRVIGFIVIWVALALITLESVVRARPTFGRLNRPGTTG